jgi:ubiquinol-cytochrome c reductase cytochrome c subunit
VIHALLLAIVVSGRDLYDVHCSSCHGINLTGSVNAPPLINVDAQDVDFMLRTGRMPSAAPYIQDFDHRSIFTNAEIHKIETYVMSQSTGQKQLPSVHLSGDVQTLDRGREVWEENCEQCHAATGHGNGIGYRDVAPDLESVDPQIVADAVRMGPDIMPRFGPHIISPRDLDALASYVRYLQTAQYNPGGLQLANWGPIAEGFIAWGFGIGGLMLLIRRIGEP